MKKITLSFICLVSALNINATVYSGSCGDNARYSLDTETGLLAITGTGAMTDYTSSKYAPWYKNAQSSYIKTIEITSGITSIGNYAFYGCSNIISVTIPNSVTSIGGSAFQSCSGLISIEIPNSVTSIGSCAFYYCPSLTSITIPNKVTSIEGYTFYNCSSLTSIIIPNSVTSIGNYAFDGCSNLTKVVLNSNAITSIYYSYDSSIGSIFGSQVKEYIIGEDVTSIGEYAFQYCSGLTSVTIPNSVTSIGQYAFRNCSSLTLITIPNSVISIGQYAFSGCSNLTSVTIPNSVTSIGNYAFEGCSGLTSIEIPNSVTSIGKKAFYRCYGFTSISVETGNIKYDSRDDCNAIIETSTNSLITGCNNTIIPNSVVNIVEDAFNGCSGLSSVIIPSGVTSIGGNAFSGCSGLKSITIPNSVTSIGGNPFSGCSSLTTLTVESENTTYDSRDNCNAIIETAKNNLIAGCNGTVIPNTVTSIRSGAFSDCSGLKFMHIPAGVTFIDDYAILGCTGLSSITIDKDNSTYDSRDDCNAIIETEKNRLMFACNNTTIPASVTWYSNEAFQNCLSITLPDGMETIPHMMFDGCKRLESIIIPNSVKTIETAFRNCSNLKSITIPSSVTTISNSAFDGCVRLKYIIIDDGEENLIFYTKYPNSSTKPEWFQNCPIDSMYVGRNIDYSFVAQDNHNTYIYSPFRGCKSLRTVVFGGRVTSIGESAFNGCSGLTSIEITNSVTSIGYNAFFGCTGLTSVTIPNSVTSIGSYAFSDCSGLTSVTIGNSVTSIGYNTFFGCTGLTSVTIPNSVTSIGEQAFSFCFGLKSVTIGNSVTSIGYNAFYNCNGLTSVICKATSVPSTSYYNVFYNVPQSEATLYVPASAVDAYKTTSPWSGFGTIIAIPDVLRGDANCDGEVNTDDVTFVTNIILGIEDATEAADVNNDGKIAIQDVMFIVNYIKNGNFPE